jgi:hypothetical protein
MIWASVAFFTVLFLLGCTCVRVPHYSLGLLKSVSGVSRVSFLPPTYMRNTTDVIYYAWDIDTLDSRDTLFEGHEAVNCYSLLRASGFNLH